MAELGIVPELLEACCPKPGEMCVSWVDRNSRMLGAALWPGSRGGVVGSWDEFSLRYCGPWAPRSGHWFSPGDIVVKL
jgi:hypothetical protein